MLENGEFEGRVFSGYRVDQLLGHGGMGVVYRALDVQLGRPVALKFVAPSSGSDPQSRARLLREAQAAAALNHPNICTIYAVGEAEGQLFIAMEYLEGADLKKMVAGKPMNWEKAVSICLRVARALEEAHGKGVIHRDVKCANIFLTRQGVVKLVDFGLASCLVDPDKTKTISVGGTPSYMAPEQIEDGITDPQTDIWSLGVVLFETLTGSLPFGRQGKSVLSSILIDEPSRLTAVRPDVPAVISQIVGKALAKKREQRYATMAEMAADLEQLSGATGVTDRHTRTFSGMLTAIEHRTEAPVETRTIAVLPLLNLSPDPENEYICDGVAEEVINGLTQMPGLRVVSRSSSFQCKGTNLDVREIGRKLRAFHLVQGSLRRSGDQLRLTVQLSETHDGYQIWSQRFDAGMKDLFSLQDELTEAILKQLRIKLGPESTNPPALKRSHGNPEAHEFYLRARYFLNRQTGEGLRQALECLALAVELDPEQAHIHIAIAECYALLEWYGLESTAEAIDHVKKALETGLRLDPNSVPGLCLLATVQAGYDWDWATAEQTFNTALALGPGFSAVQFHYALDLLTPLGRLEEALAAIRRALELDPLSAITSTALGGCYYRMRRWSEAAASLRTTLELNPGFGHAHWSLGRVLIEQNHGEEALWHFREAIRVMGETPAGLAELGYGLARTGHRRDAHEIVEKLKTMAGSQFVSPVNLALVYAGLHNLDAAVAELETAFAQRARQLVWINVDPRFASLGDDAGFQKLISGMGLTIPAFPKGQGSAADA
jgi:serine/threonine-protein kinase